MQKRREEERKKAKEKNERLTRAAKCKENTLVNIERNKTQTKITNALAKLPENKQKILEMEEEKERNMMMDDARDELWRR